MKTAINLYIKNKGDFLLNEYIFKIQKGINASIDKLSVRERFNSMAIDLNLSYMFYTFFKKNFCLLIFINSQKRYVTFGGTSRCFKSQLRKNVVKVYYGIDKEKKPC